MRRKGVGADGDGSAGGHELPPKSPTQKQVLDVAGWGRQGPPWRRADAWSEKRNKGVNDGMEPDSPSTYLLMYSQNMEKKISKSIQTQSTISFNSQRKIFYSKKAVNQSQNRTIPPPPKKIKDSEERGPRGRFSCPRAPPWEPRSGVRSAVSNPQQQVSQTHLDPNSYTKHKGGIEKRRKSCRK